MPEIIDSDNDLVTVKIDSKKFSHLSYDADKNALVVEKDTTTEADMGSYVIKIRLDDGYEYGQSDSLFFLTLVVDTPDRPFYVFIPKNEAPVFVEDLTTEE